MANKKASEKPDENGILREAANIAQAHTDSALMRIQGEKQIEREKEEELEAANDDIRLEAIYQTAEYFQAHNELFKAMILYKAKQSKSYRKGGLTWEKFCEKLGVNWRTADRIIEDVKPVFEKYSDNCQKLTGLEFRQIRYLGRSISDNLSEIQDNILLIGGEKIPLTPEYKDDIQAALEKLQEEQKKQIEDKEATIKAKERVSAGKEDIIKKLEKDLAKLEGQAKTSGYTRDEAAYLKKLEVLRMAWDGMLCRLTLDENPEPLSDEGTKRMQAAYLALAVYIRNEAYRIWLAADECFGGPGMAPGAEEGQMICDDIARDFMAENAREYNEEVESQKDLQIEPVF